jgi:hypothetical protein
MSGRAASAGRRKSAEVLSATLGQLSGRWLAEIDRTPIPCYHVASEDNAMMVYAVPAPSSPKSVPFPGFG